MINILNRYRSLFCYFLVICLIEQSVLYSQSPSTTERNKQTDPKQKDYSGELPRIPVLEPKQALASFQFAPGFHLQQTAVEPIVVDPVAMSFDAQGRLYVIEMRGYSEQDDENLGRVRLLEDTNQDGFFDHSTVFADQLSWPTAIICFDGGIFIGAAPEIIYLKDTNHDQKADVKQTVLHGFGKGNVQGLLNSFRWGLDNRIHGATSSSGGEIQRTDNPFEKPVQLRGRDFSFDPRKLDLRPESGGAQHGLCFDDWGRKFVCSNSNHAQAVMYDDAYIARNPYFNPPGPRISIADDGGQAPVFRTSDVEPWRIVRTRLRVAGEVPGPVEGGGTPAGYFTGSTGITIYRGDAYPKSMRGIAIIGDVGSNIVHRKQIKSNGLEWIASRIDQKSEFVTSNDIWFRPVQFANAPDGCLHILDMYREVIEHPKSLPPEIKQHLDLTSGRDRGRLYRVEPEGYTFEFRGDIFSQSTVELVSLLNHPNAWHRETASRLLFERQDLNAVVTLQKMAKSGTTTLGRMHALHVLAGLKSLTVNDVLPRLTDKNSQVRCHAIKLAEQYSDSLAIRNQLKAMVHDQDARVRFQLAFSLGQFPTQWKTPILNELLISDVNDAWVRIAVQSSTNKGAALLVKQMLHSNPQKSSASGTLMLNQLTAQIAKQNDPAEIATLLSVISKLEADQQSLAESLILVLTKTNPALKKQLSGHKTGALLTKQLKEARQIINDGSKSLVARINAVGILSLGDFSTDGDSLIALLDNQFPPNLQQAVLETLHQYDDPQVAETLLKRWSQLSPAIRATALDLLLSNSAWTIEFLTQIEQGKLPLAEVSFAQLQVMKQNPNSKIKKLTTRLLSQSGVSNRKDVVASYQAALQLSGNIEKGRLLFRETCASCHKLEGVGDQLGPNLATTKARGKATIMLNILDPNREVDPRFLNYLVLTSSGKTHSGVISSETATSITLQQTGKQTTAILRADIELLRSTGLSIMPEGLEKKINLQSMADLLSYLESTN
ncbi:MAG: cytochrome C [Blastopirellula sp.]|nr:MAG: cytochrome C [Blastopirellula sp.]